MAPRLAADRRADLVRLYRELSDDHACPLAPGRTHIVFGTGHADADLMFVGEAPGAEEDRQGKPFVGRAGRLLDDLLAGIGLDRTQVFVANVLKCRPPSNRDPLPEKIEECSTYLFRTIELIEPKVICTLGNFATKLLTGSKVGITRCRGRAQAREIAGLAVQLYPLCHPAAGLRSDEVLRTLREDFSRLPALVEGARAAPPPAAAASALGRDLPNGSGDPGTAGDQPAVGTVADARGASAQEQLGLFG